MGDGMNKLYSTPFGIAMEIMSPVDNGPKWAELIEYPDPRKSKMEIPAYVVGIGSENPILLYRPCKPARNPFFTSK